MSISEEKNDLIEITLYSPFLIREGMGIDHCFSSLEELDRAWGEQYSEYYKYNIWIVRAEKVHISRKGQAGG